MREFDHNELVKIECHDCAGCHACCQDMGQSVALTPWDVYMLCDNMGMSFEELLGGCIEIHLEEGIVTPNLTMVTKSESAIPACGFLNEQHRCSIHAFRPGICRLFPLGRNYYEDKVTYFVLEDACPAEGKSKIKISKWLGIEQIKSYERFLVAWHNYLKECRARMMEAPELAKDINMDILTRFYNTPYEGDFYEEVFSRMESC